MPNTIKRKQGDTDPITGSVTHAGDDDPLTAANEVRIFIREKNSDTNLVDDVVDSFTAAGAWVWTPLDTEVEIPGEYLTYIKVDYAGPLEQRFPSSGYGRIIIEPNFE